MSMINIQLYKVRMINQYNYIILTVRVVLYEHFYGDYFQKNLLINFITIQE